jgi:TPR repeat protein
MKLIRPISLVLLCFAFVPSLALGQNITFVPSLTLAQTAEIDALIKKDAEMGDASAQVLMGHEFYLVQNFSDAIKWYQMAVDQKNTEAYYFLASLFFHNENVKEGKHFVYDDLFRQAADEGHVESQYAFGVILENGIPDLAVDQDYKSAINWYKKAAEKDHVHATYSLARLYDYGKGVAENDEMAIKLYRKSFILGDERGQYNGALLKVNQKYKLSGEKPPQMKARERDAVASAKLRAKKAYDLELCINYLIKRANYNDYISSFKLGWLYEYEAVVYKKRLVEIVDKHRQEAVDRNRINSAKWYLKSAELGYPESQLRIASWYTIGHGVPKNAELSADWKLRAANQGYESAQFLIGTCYEQGEGVVESIVEAYKWYNLAAAQGNSVAKNYKERLERKMPLLLVAEAQRLSAAFKPRKEIPNKAGGTTRPEVATSLPDAFGSGFYVTSNGYLLTNQHVVDGARQVFIYSGSKKLPARVVKTDAANDLALLKVSGTFAALPVSSSRRVKLGQTVSTVGFPNPDLQGKSPKLTKGEISSLSGASDDPKYFQISVPLQPGNSGGPLVDGYGNVVGVVTAKLSTKAALATAGTLPENVNYAVKGTFVMGFLESVPDVAAEMLDPKPRRSREFTEVVSEAEEASVMILVYE